MHKSFKILEEEYFPDYAIDYNVFEHEKSAARVFFLKRKDKRQSFLIDFLTAPSNSKGVPHILEHLVLSGSKKYDFGSKDPFFELVRKKNLSNLNAATYPERTRYYFESIDKKDFFETLDIYLDAVFNPLVLQKEILFKREAWRIDKDPNGNFIYSGTVLNEMQGRLLNPARHLERAIMKATFGKSIYDHDSGGLPEEIIKLDYKELVEFYKENYHPSNSRIFVFGDLDETKVLDKLDEYLSSYEKSEKVFRKNIEKIPRAKNRSSRSTLRVPGEKDSSYMAFAFKGPDKRDYKNNLALSIIISVLNKESSVLRKNITQSKLCSDFSIFADYDYFYNPLIIFSFEKMKAENFAKLKSIFKKSLRELKKNGLNKKLLFAKLDSLRLQEEILKSSVDMSAYLLEALPRFFWLEDPKVVLRKTEVLREIKRDFEEDELFFDKIFDEFILSNASFEAYVKTDPKLEHFKAFKKASVNLQKLSAKKKELVEKQVKEYSDFSEQELGKGSLPVSKFSLPKKSQAQVNVKDASGRKIFFAKMKNCNWVNADIYFNLSHLSDLQVQNLQVLSMAFDKLETENHHLEELDILKTANFNIKISIENYSNERKRQVFLHLSLQYLKENEQKALRILKELLFNLKIDKNALEQSRKEFILKVEQDLSWFAARNYAENVAKSMLDSASALSDKLFYLGFFSFLQSLKVDTAKLERLWSSAINNSLALAYSSSTKSNALEDFFLSIKRARVKTKDFPPFKVKTGDFYIKSKLFANHSNTFSISFPKKDKLKTLFATALQYEIFSEEIRDKGGAYGATSSCSHDCSVLSFTSFADPHYERTINLFKDSFNILSKAPDELFELARLKAAFAYINPQADFLLAMRDFIFSLKGTSFEKELEDFKKTLSVDNDSLRKKAKQISKKIKDFPSVSLSFMPSNKSVKSAREIKIKGI